MTQSVTVMRGVTADNDTKCDSDARCDVTADNDTKCDSDARCDS